MADSEKSEYCVELNRLQDATLDLISTSRDQVEVQFSEHANADSGVDYTLKRLFSFMSDRSQVVSYLVSSNFVWDSEIILRSFYEANAKIWLICLSPPNERNALLEEFWGALANAHNHKRAYKAASAKSLFEKHNKLDEATVFAALENRNIFDRSSGNRKDRKNVEKRWSFSEIVKFLELNSPKEFDLRDAPGLLHMYGMQSHLIHADETAMDLMLDRKMRSREDLDLLLRAHVSRIFSDQAGLWVFSFLALRHRYDRKTNIGGDLLEKYKDVLDMAKPFADRHYVSQGEFYRDIEK